MRKMIVPGFIAFVLFAGCASTKSGASLGEVTTQRVYAVDKMKLLDAMRMYCSKFDFVLRGVEPEMGRVRAYKKMETLRAEEARTVLMLVYVVGLRDGRSRVEAKFVYDKLEGTPTQQDEFQLAQCYSSLFNHLDKEVQ